MILIDYYSKLISKIKRFIRTYNHDLVIVKTDFRLILGRVKYFNAHDLYRFFPIQQYPNYLNLSKTQIKNVKTRIKSEDFNVMYCDYSDIFEHRYKPETLDKSELKDLPNHVQKSILFHLITYESYSELPEDWEYLR